MAESAPNLVPELETRFEPIMVRSEATQPVAKRPVAAVLALGCVALLMLGAQPVILGAWLGAHRLSVPELSYAAMAEMLALGAVSGGMAALLQHRHLWAWSLVGSVGLILANAGCLAANGLGLVACRALAGACGGVIVWIGAGVITRSRSAAQLSAIYLGAQALSQAALAAALPFLAPRLGADAGAWALGLMALVTAPLVLLIPRQLPDLPRPDAGQGALSGVGVSGLLSSALMMAGVVGLWVFVDAIGRADHVSATVGAYAVSASLVMQIAGAAAVATLGGRLAPATTLLVAGLLELLVVGVLAGFKGDLPFVAATLLFGFLWSVVLPMFVPLLIRSDPTRRAAMLLSGAQLLGSSAGPLVTGALASEADVRPVLAVSAVLMAGAVAALLVLLQLERRGAPGRPA